MSQQAVWIRGAILLTVAGFLSKVLGMVYRVPLQNIAGDEGLYIYQQIYPILSIALMLSIYSLPSAISHIVAKNRLSDGSSRLPKEWQVFVLLLGAGASIFIIIFFSANQLAAWMGDSNLGESIQVASVMFLIIPITASLRGFFQGLELTSYIAVSQIIEQFVRVLFIIGFTVFIIMLTNQSVYHIGPYAAWATVIGTVVAGVFLLLAYKYNLTLLNLPQRLKLSPNIMQVFLISVVIYSLNYMLHLVLQLVDVFTMVEQLQVFGLAFDEAKETKGVFDRSHSMIQLGLVLGSSLALALVPSIGKKAKQHLLAFRWTFLLALSASVGLIAIMPFLNPLLFETNTGTYALQWMMLLVFLLSMTVVLSIFLQEYHYRMAQFKWIIVMVAIKYIFNLILIPYYGSIGSSVAYVLAAGFLLVVFIYKWIRLTGFQLPYVFMSKTIGVVSAMGLIVFSLLNGLSNWANVNERIELIPFVLLLCIIGVIIVGSGMLVLKLFTKDEWKQLLGDHIVNRFERS
ncbi:stage V sporulation protein B [Tenuibacillus multivorans]|uniref:Polysaccharide transporter, PST family n=2 Tax=Tenuibacillus multivorans TaxID=237069 RepID=A0A1G9W0D0_9BACI|nr:polysaccharide biosynthesis protein [Tenuibacillus multivorans]GEL78254.1 stage V sporulation protein B [Tenuibacillus multivorans]SDM77515.1 polysaccharide transporter, PST family [Tenuibacillus multivorans]